MTNETANQILDALTSQTFDEFYKGELEDFITGGYNCDYDDMKANLFLEISYLFRNVDALKN